MVIAVSPYHITTREAPAMAAFLLAERVVTLVPTPADPETAGSARAAAARIPGYGEFMKSWAWTAPLWRAGVVTAEVGGETPIGDMHGATARVHEDEGFAPLRPFMREHLYEDEAHYLGAVAADLLKGGPDPGISLPVVAGIDRFATRLGLLVARPHAASVAQRAEVRMGRALFTVALPMLVQASAERLLHAREVLRDVGETLRLGFDEAAAAGVRGGGVGGGDGAWGVGEAAAAYARAFEARRGELTEDCRSDEVRLVEGAATVTALLLPSDAALRSSVAAMDQVARGKAPRRPVEPAPHPAGGAPGAMTVLPVRYDPVEGKHFVALVIKPLGGGPARRR